MSLLQVDICFNDPICNRDIIVLLHFFIRNKI